MLTSIIGYAEHFVVHHTYQIYSLRLMRAKAVGSKLSGLNGSKRIGNALSRSFYQRRTKSPFLRFRADYSQWRFSLLGPCQ